MKKVILAVALSSLSLGSTVFAEETTPSTEGGSHGNTTEVAKPEAVKTTEEGATTTTEATPKGQKKGKEHHKMAKHKKAKKEEKKAN